VLSYSNLLPNQVRHVYIKSKVHSWVNVGQVVPARFEMKTNCSNNNTFATDGAIQAKGSPHDPNGKSVNKKIVCAGNAVPHSLVYTIHFQNVGSAPAHDVFIEDILPPELDPSTVQVLSSSASYTLPNVPPPLLKISFPGIDLPGAAQPGVTFNQTIGTISFRVNTINCLLPGQIIPNMATIEFLGQPSIQTGVAYTMVDENFCHDVCTDEPHHLPGDRTGTLDIFEIKPNPVTDALWIQISPKHNWELSIYDTQGRSYYSSAGAADQDETVNIQVQTNDWPSGVYFVKWSDAAQHPVRKVIKL
jgi:uncharacterized repeat protein (TIGR01451 family)